MCIRQQGQDGVLTPSDFFFFCLMSIPSECASVRRCGQQRETTGATECAPSLFFSSFILFISFFITNYCVLPQQPPSTCEGERAGRARLSEVPQPPGMSFPL